jgi:hypothetical protein
MIPNKRNLKAYVRLDGMKRVVAGSLILRKHMPKMGKWEEVPAYECCNPVSSGTTTTTTTITGSPTRYAMSVNYYISDGAACTDGMSNTSTVYSGYPPESMVGKRLYTNMSLTTPYVEAGTVYPIYRKFIVVAGLFGYYSMQIDPVTSNVLSVNICTS